MKTFLDLQDTNYQNRIIIRLQAICDNGLPTCQVTVNNTELFHDAIASTVNLETYVSVNKPIEIDISLSNKHYSSTAETALIIQQISIDNFDLIPNWTGACVYDNDQLMTGATTYLGFNGTWKFMTHEPFYHWKHRVTGQGWLLYPQTLG